jgi:hypothetical protein
VSAWVPLNRRIAIAARPGAELRANIVSVNGDGKIIGLQEAVNSLNTR